MCCYMGASSANSGLILTGPTKNGFSNYPPGITLLGITEKVSIWFPADEGEYCEEVVLRMWIDEDAHWESNAIINKLVHFQKQLDNVVQACVVNQIECNRLEQHTFNKINHDAVPLQVDNITA
jgi:hypothetical protein